MSSEMEKELFNLYDEIAGDQYRLATEWHLLDPTARECLQADIDRNQALAEEIEDALMDAAEAEALSDDMPPF